MSKYHIVGNNVSWLICPIKGAGLYGLKTTFCRIGMRHIHKRLMDTTLKKYNQNKNNGISEILTLKEPRINAFENVVC